jgi:two-component system, LytTR family, sensor kinase
MIRVAPVISCSLSVIRYTIARAVPVAHDSRMTAGGIRTSRVAMITLVVGAFFTAQEVFMDVAGRRTQLASQDIVNGFEFWIVWALLTPIVVAAVRRWPLERPPIIAPVTTHAAIALALAAAHNVITHLVDASRASALTGSASPFYRPPNATAFVWGVFTGVVYYTVVVMFCTAVAFRRLYVVEQAGAAALRAELTQSKLDALRSQLRPHFLFNTLNAISVFVAGDSAKAQQMILRLSSLLRRSLDEDAHEVPLAEELAFANDYLDIQRGRFGDRLAVVVDVRDDALRAHVPVLVLQPLLENAIEHGILEERPTTVTLHASRAGHLLHITVIDDGPGAAGAGERRQGIGLGNTRARLAHLYGSRSSVEWRAADPQSPTPGMRVAIRLPFHEHPL